MHSGELIHDRYRLEETLGSGGMAEVWRATDERLERSVAIKFPASNLVDDPEFMVRFFSEAQAVARLSHPNVVKVLDFGDHEGRSFLVMEHVPGGSLKELIEDGPMDTERACDLMRQAALAAGAAHSEEIVHRDIKPGNILIDEQGHVKLADFGIASSAVAERLTATGATIGSPHYVSPEQVSGELSTARSDVYALGVVLYELLTGVKPIDADSIAAIAIAQVEEEPAPPSDHVPDLDAGVSALVMRCLQKDPAERFADGNELAGALGQFARPTRSTVVAPVVPVAMDDEVYTIEEYEASEARRPGWLIPGAAIAALLLAIGIAFALSRPTEQARARPPVPDASETEKDKPRKKRSPSPSVSPTIATDVTAPSPVASEDGEEDDDAEDSANEDDDEDRPGETRRPPRPRPRPSRPPRTNTPPPTPAASPSA